MKIAEINMVDYGSTGRIMFQIAERARENGFEVKTFSMKWRNNRPRENHDFYGYFLENALHVILADLAGFQGCYSYFGTRQLVKALERFDPDIIHLHNLHNYSTNLKVLFSYLRKRNKKVVWTLHDTWAFCGQCMYFTYAGCEEWRNGCRSCSFLRNKLKINDAAYLWRMKRSLFTGLEMTFVSPSGWLEKTVKQSFLAGEKTKVIHNGIDLSVFHPMETQFRKKHGIQDGKKVVLGVAQVWGERKGLDYFIRLAKDLDERFQIVLVGTDEAIDRQLPENILSIHRTESQEQLAEIYSSADVFVIPTREDNFPTTNIEALACGTPVITMNTGGSPEIIDAGCGVTVPYEDYEALLRTVRTVCERMPFSKEACRLRAEQFDMNEKYDEYIRLYKEMTGGQG